MISHQVDDPRFLAGVKRLISPRYVGRLSVSTRTLIRLASWAPGIWLRILFLRLAGAKIAEDLSLSPAVFVLNPWRLQIGSHNNIARGVQLDARGGLVIGDNVNISEEVAIWTAEHDVQSASFDTTMAKTVIGNRAWLCFRCVIMPGVEIGEGAVVAACAVVTKSVPPFTIVGGVPAKILGRRNPELTYQLGRSSGPI